MKKILMFIIGAFLFCMFSITVYAKTPTMNEIVDKFNSNKTVKEYAELGSVWKASSEGNTLTVTITAQGTNSKVSYTLDGNVLSTSVSGDDLLMGHVISNVLVNSIGTFHGHAEGDLSATFNSTKVSSYTLEKEGLQITNDGTTATVKIDISKKIPVLDLSEEYFEVSDLETSKEFISGDGFSEYTKGNLYYHKTGYGNEHTLIVAEKDNLTNSAYKSILSLVEVMFNSKDVADYFKNNYPSISNNKEFTGFKVEVNPTKTSSEESLFSKAPEFKFVRITIDKEAVNKRDTTNNGGTSNDTENNNTQTPNTNNQTNTNEVIMPYSLNLGTNYTLVMYIAFGAIFGSFILYVIKNKKKTPSTETTTATQTQPNAQVSSSVNNTVNTNAPQNAVPMQNDVTQQQTANVTPVQQSVPQTGTNVEATPASTTPVSSTQPQVAPIQPTVQQPVQAPQTPQAQTVQPQVTQVQVDNEQVQNTTTTQQ